MLHMRQKVTLKQIAKELDVSISTVSKALRNSTEISEDTIEKVQAFAKLYNYRPNNIALSLKNRKTKTIGVIIPEIVHYFFSKVISGIEQTAIEKGYNVIVGLSNESFKTEIINIDTLANGSIDGFIMSISKETLQLQDYHHLNETIDQGMPIVLFDRVIDEVNCDKVIVDDFSAAKKATTKLLENGCRKIALISTKDYVNVGKLRTEGYINALEERGIRYTTDLILKVDDKDAYEEHLDALENDIINLYSNHNDIDGIVAVNELYALTAVKAVRKLGKQVPDDVQVVGFTDGMLSKHATPSLTTIRQHGEAIGRKAAELLIERLERDIEDDQYETIVIETELIERESTK